MSCLACSVGMPCGAFRQSQGRHMSHCARAGSAGCRARVQECGWAAGRRSLAAFQDPPGPVSRKLRALPPFLAMLISLGHLDASGTCDALLVGTSPAQDRQGGRLWEGVPLHLMARSPIFDLHAYA